MNCCCPDCNFSSFPMSHAGKEKLLERCEMNGCQYDSPDGNCVSGPGWHHCTAKCATTASPTAEPTDEPTSEPTPAPTPEPTAEPTDEPTGEPTPSPSIGECPENGMDFNGDSCNGFEAVCKYDFVECCGNRGPNTICQCENGTFQCVQHDRCINTCEPTVDNGGG